MIGMPPPPQATTMWPARAESRIMCRWTTRTGRGEATRRRQPRPESSRTFHPRRAVRSSACSFVRNGPMGLDGSLNAGSSLDENLGDHRHDVPLDLAAAQVIEQRLLEDVSQEP